MDGFEEFAYTPVEEEKNGRDSASKLPFSHVSLFFQFCVCGFFRSICIYYDSLRFALLWLFIALS